MKIFDFFIQGVNKLVQFGRNNGFIEYNESQSKFITTLNDNSTLARVASGHGIFANELSTIDQVKTASGGAYLFVSFEIDGSLPILGNYENQLGYCIKSGGSFVEGKIYIFQNSAWALFELQDDQEISFAIQIESENNKIFNISNVLSKIFYKNRIYTFDVATQRFYDTENNNNIYKQRAVHYQLDSNSNTFLPFFKVGSIIKKISVTIAVTFLADFSVFEVKNGADILFDIEDADFTNVDTYIKELNYELNDYNLVFTWDTIEDATTVQIDIEYLELPYLL